MTKISKDEQSESAITELGAQETKAVTGGDGADGDVVFSSGGSTYSETNDVDTSVSDGISINSTIG